MDSENKTFWTVQELYNWAKKHKACNAAISTVTDDGSSCFYIVPCVISRDDTGEASVVSL